jgi:hypothetical protein
LVVLDSGWCLALMMELVLMVLVAVVVVGLGHVWL